MKHIVSTLFVLHGCATENLDNVGVAHGAATILGTLEDGSYCVEERVLTSSTATENYTNVQAAVAEALAAITEVKGVMEAGLSLRSGYGCPPHATRFRYRIKFPAGDFYLDPGGDVRGVAGTRAQPAIRLHDPDLASLDVRRELVFQGVGRNSTRLRTPWDVRWIHAIDASYVTIRDLTLRQDSPHQYKVSQGWIRHIGTSENLHYIDLAIDAGFPHPGQIDQDEGRCKTGWADPDRCRGQKWLRRYERFNGDPNLPRMIVTANDQVAWVAADPSPVPGAPDTYRIYVHPGAHPASGPHPYAGFAQTTPPTRIAIKSKHANPDAYRFVGGRNIKFSNVRLVNETRGLFDEVNNVTFQNVLVTPLTEDAALASSGGGPQFRGGVGHLAIGNRLFHLGDDALGFHASVRKSSAVSNTITDNFARGILIEGPSAGVTRSGNRLVRNYPNVRVVPADPAAQAARATVDGVAEDGPMVP